jgi:hypothetical protein
MRHPEACLYLLHHVAAAGLEDQLLGKLILKEKHELEEQRQQLLEEVQSYKKKIKQLEDDLLFRWASFSHVHLQSSPSRSLVCAYAGTQRLGGRGKGLCILQ